MNKWYILYLIQTFYNPSLALYKVLLHVIPMWAHLHFVSNQNNQLPGILKPHQNQLLKKHNLLLLICRLELLFEYYK